MSAAIPERLETARMVGERMRPDHLRELGSLLRDPQVARTLSPSEGPPSESRVAESLERHIGHWSRHGFGLWMLFDRGSGAMVGRGGLLHTEITGVQETELGWAIMPSRWGEGLATELAHASLSLAWHALPADSVIAYALLTNAASRRVMEKSGFAYEDEFEYLGLPHVLYRIRRPAASAESPSARLVGSDL